MEVRVRFAPSPTGYLHVGGARTALFNWLFARHCGGKFILRIEDTDYSRSSLEMVEGILEALRWMGLDWDEGPVFQSQRLERYRSFACRLLEERRAYRCFCLPDEPEGDQQSEPAARIYDRRCREITEEDSGRRAASGSPFAIRFLVPQGRTSYHDGVYGDIEVENEQIEDFVLLRSDGLPTYHLGVVVDDMEMDITHVIRGADHISNTPKQVLLYQAVNHHLPAFAHLPLILGPDRQRLSKRHGATSVMAYAGMGYLPDAFVNFLALLGWSPGGDRELLSRRELIELFRLEDVGRANAVFGLEKLDWFNSQYIARATESELRDLVVAELKRQGLWGAEHQYLPRESLDRTLALLRSRAHTLLDFSGRFRSYFIDDFPYEEEAVRKFLQNPRLAELVTILLQRYELDDVFTVESTEKHLRAVAAEQGIKAGLLINALRVGLTGQAVAPGLFDVMQALGRARTLARMRRLAQYLRPADQRREEDDQAGSQY
jgi:glutamyl-tRNA synthetase